MYEQYITQCKNLYCEAYLHLPSDQIWIEGDADDLNITFESTWPSEEWRSSIACVRCRNVRTLTAEDVWSYLSDEQLKQPQCLLVEMGCAKPECRIPIRFFIPEIDDYYPCRAMGDDVRLGDDIVSLLREGFFKGKCPRGHEFGMLPRELYRITPHLGTIPSQHDDLNWVQHSTRLIGAEAKIPPRAKRHQTDRRMRG